MKAAAGSILREREMSVHAGSGGDVGQAGRRREGWL
jgi:hypothetical protein